MMGMNLHIKNYEENSPINILNIDKHLNYF